MVVSHGDIVVSNAAIVVFHDDMIVSNDDMVVLNGDITVSRPDITRSNADLTVSRPAKPLFYMKITSVAHKIGLFASISLRLPLPADKETGKNEPPLRVSQTCPPKLPTSRHPAEIRRADKPRHPKREPKQDALLMTTFQEASKNLFGNPLTRKEISDMLPRVLDS